MGSISVIDFSITPLGVLLNSKMIRWLLRERIPAGPLFTVYCSILEYIDDLYCQYMLMNDSNRALPSLGLE